MIESDQTITSAQATYHATDVTGATYTASTDTITKASQDLNVGDVISVTSASGTNTITTGRYKVKTRTSYDAAVLEGMDNSALTFSGDGTAICIYKGLFTECKQSYTYQQSDGVPQRNASS